MSDPIYPFFQRSYFEPLAASHKEKYKKAFPFPHAVIEDFLPLEIAEPTHNSFPGRNLESFEQPDNEFQVNKLGRTQENDFAGVPPFVRHLLNDLNAKVFIDFLEALTGIQGLIPDPHYFGGALHQILPGGSLAIHADFNRHRRLKLDRRLNVLIYFNKNWKPEYGGDLELWDTEMTFCAERIAPLFNRCVVFNTTSNSFHGHPIPLTCPEDRTRNSIAMYYYTNGRPEAETSEAHSTLWQDRPDADY